MKDKRMGVLQKLQDDIARIAQQNIEEAKKRHPEIKNKEELQKVMIRPEIMEQLDTVMKASFRNLIKGNETDPDSRISKHVYQSLDYDAEANEKAAAKEAEKQAKAKAQAPKISNTTSSIVQGETNKQVNKSFLDKFDSLMAKKNSNE
ncbi:hypothetical protein [Burkholderia cenocepacia]|uniref:hypothetical protein n=1 Tax=Burkholderia cenocepacia TaxID=95486 RepID=UPI001177B3EB|nr:hypothetical protein [Burkholderia cenocepacia]